MVYRDKEGQKVTRATFEAEINKLGNQFMSGLFKLAKTRPTVAIEGFAFDRDGAAPMTDGFGVGLGGGIAVFFAHDLRDLTAKKLLAVFERSTAYDVVGALVVVLEHAVAFYRATKQERKSAAFAENKSAIDNAIADLFFALRQERRAKGI